MERRKEGKNERKKQRKKDKKEKRKKKEKKGEKKGKKERRKEGTKERRKKRKKEKKRKKKRKKREKIERRKEGKKERRKEGKKERRKEGKKERRKEGKKERRKEGKKVLQVLILRFTAQQVTPVQQASVQSPSSLSSKLPGPPNSFAAELSRPASTTQQRIEQRSSKLCTPRAKTITTSANQRYATIMIYYDCVSYAVDRVS